MEPKRAVRMSGYTQQELADVLGMDKWQFNKKLRGWNGMRFTADQIDTLRSLGVAVDELFPEPDPSPEVA